MSADERDDLVARALGSLPVPEHRPGFWKRLDGAIDAIDAEQRTEMQDTQVPPVEASEAAEVHDLDAARRFPRRTGMSGRRYQMLSAAAVVAVVLAGVAVLNNGGGRGKTNEPIAAAQLGDPEVKAQFEAVQAFYNALEKLDVDKTWDLLGPISKAQAQRKSELERFFESRRTAGVERFDHAPQQDWESFGIPGDPEGAVVSTPAMSDGKIAGSPFMPVVRDNGRWLVEFGIFSTGGIRSTTEMVSRSARKPGEPIDIPIEVSSDERGELYGRLDGQGLFTKLEHKGNGLFQYDRKLSDLPPGAHYLETVLRGPDWFFVHSVDLSGISTTPTTAGGTEPAASPAISAVQAWSKAIDDGDAERAWALMGPDSQAYLTAQGGWEQMVFDMAEGSHAAWNRTDGVRWEVRNLDPSSAVVTASGTLELEGTKEYRTDAYPIVRDAKGVWRVEPFAFGPGDTDAEFVNPALGQNGLSGVGPAAVIEVDVIPGSQVFISLDGGLEPMQRKSERRWTYDPPGDLSNGTHQVIVITRGDTWFTAHPAEFAVEG